MKVKFTTWNRYGQIISCLVMPLVILDQFWEPKWWTDTYSIIAFSIISVAIGIPVFLFWTRIAKIEFVFSEKAKERFSYKMWKSWCERSGRPMPDGSKLSKS
ncbi:MAG TPA: hypothetical protein VF480_11325, partial [Verrucomicrobiae bacterium]